MIPNSQKTQLQILNSQVKDILDHKVRKESHGGSFIGIRELIDLRICFLDNEEDLVKDFKRKFESIFRRCMVTIHSSEAYKLVADNSIDILLCDYKMPRDNGIEVLKKCYGLNPKVDLILYTGYTLTENRNEECQKYKITKISKLEGADFLAELFVAINRDQVDKISFGNEMYERVYRFSSKRALKGVSIQDVLIDDESSTDSLPDHSNPVTTGREVEEDFSINLKQSASLGEIRTMLLELSQDLISGYKEMPPSTVIHLSHGEKITVSDLLEHIEATTPLGMSQIKLWIEANAFVRNISENKKDRT